MVSATSAAPTPASSPLRWASGFFAACSAARRAARPPASGSGSAGALSKGKRPISSPGPRPGPCPYPGSCPVGDCGGAAAYAPGPEGGTGGSTVVA